ncbi:unnamed protein product, partial [Prorocentrum cordatum]
AERERARCAAHAQSRARRARFGSLPREARQASGSVPKKCPMKAKLAEQNTRSQRGEQEEQRPGGRGGGGGGGGPWALGQGFETHGRTLRALPRHGRHQFSKLALGAH